MRLPCPFCGERMTDEFTYLGDAKLAERPAEGATWEHVFFRDNPTGRHRELWRHESGCGAWLTVERDVSTHEIFSATLVDGGRDAG
ncbi:MAG: sarcosine oxidase subunit delta [Pikeienuella sp.]